MPEFLSRFQENGLLSEAGGLQHYSIIEDEIHFTNGGLINNNAM